MDLERMDDFFTARVEIYDEHMLAEVEGCKEGYAKMAELVPSHAESLLDLGCGTGLELNEIFSKIPSLRVTGVDLTQAMLDKLRAKFSGKELNLICASYFDCDFGMNLYDVAVSFQTMHHFKPEDKIRLYSRIREALKPGGCYIECDYMVLEPEEEAFWFAENERIRAEKGIPLDAFYHYDTPCTICHQTEMLREAGFARVEQVFRMENTTILVAAGIASGVVIRK